MKITVLIENTTNGELIAEHGLSLYIEHNGKKILLDAGSTNNFAENAKKLGIDIEAVDICVLSHGHYDHSGGFDILLTRNEDVKIYARKSALDTYLSAKGGMHEISVPKDIREKIDRFCLVEGNVELLKGVYLIPHTTEGLEKIGEKAGLYKMLEEEIVPDDFLHEQSLVVETEKGLVIFNSCSHGGVENIIKEVKEVCDGKQIYAYIGGLHMMGKKDGEEICTFTDEELNELCKVISEEKIKHVYTGHCTGKEGLLKMKERIGNVVEGIETGMIIEA